MVFSEKKFVSEKHAGEYLNYLEYLPEEPYEKLPLVIYLHGAGSRGNDLSRMNPTGPVKELQNGRTIHAAVIAPQCHGETWFDLFQLLLEFIETYRAKSAIDPDRVYLTGCSMGAFAVWQVCISHPEWFAAAVPVCGGGMYWDAARLKNIPVWAFHGLLDTVVSPEESVKMVSAVNKNGGNAKLTVFNHNGHNAWDSAFALDELWDWLFKQKRNG